MRALSFSMLVLSGCATLSPRFEQDVASSFAGDDMQVIETDQVRLYFPSAQRERALEEAARAEECLKSLRTHDITQRNRGKALLFLTSANFNNAYVTGQSSGEPLQSVNPLGTTAEIFHWYGLGNGAPGDIACHEMFHYAHFEQIENLWAWVNAIVGPVVPVQGFTERWFTEGVAQYYEGRIERQVGRPHSPLYRSAFASFVAMRKGSISAGDLHPQQRELNPFSGAYLTSLHFVEWLVQRNGEEALWQLMDVQGRSFFSPLAVTLRFKAVYGLSVGALVDEWSRYLSANVVASSRPPSQRVVFDGVGQLGRVATHVQSGVSAIISSGNDEPPRLRILEADGRVRIEQRLIRLDLGRPYIIASPGSMSGLSFSEDGRSLYVMNDDLIDRGDTRAQLLKFDAVTGELVQHWDELGRLMGGALHPDGLHYTAVSSDPQGTSLVNIDLSTGKIDLLAKLDHAASVGALTWAPDGSRLVFSRQTEKGWNLMLRHASGDITALTDDSHFNYGAHFSGTSKIVFAREIDDKLQAFQFDIDTRDLLQLTSVPFSVIDASPTKDGVRFLNRDGNGWTFDAVDFDSSTRAAETLAALSAPPPPTPEATAKSTPPTIVSEAQPYSSLDQLFVPQLRLPTTGLLFTREGGVYATLGLSVHGRDRLGFHNWALSGSFAGFALVGPRISDRLFETQVNALSAEYQNNQLAPWRVNLLATRNQDLVKVRTAEGFGDAQRVQWSGAATIGRTIYVTPIDFGLRGQTLLGPGNTVRSFWGPTLAVSWSASETTAYAGAWRSISLGFSASTYSVAFGAARDFADLSASISGSIPLPLSTRHSLGVSLRGRALLGGERKSLVIGGQPSGTPILQSEPNQRAGQVDASIPGRFLERVRGYEDFGVPVTAAAIAQARYRYPLIIDRGFASVLYLFPSLFLRDVVLEAFGSAAYTDEPATRWQRAAGAAISLRTVLGSALPVTLAYQFSYRFDFSLPPLHSLSIDLQ
jgi:hypothetical protein